MTEDIIKNVIVAEKLVFIHDLKELCVQVVAGQDDLAATKQMLERGGETY